MKKLLISSIALAAVAVQAQTFGIASATPNGTNWPMVEDIKAVCSTPTRTINNVESNGTLDNIVLVHGDPRAQFGIAQLDGLKYQQGQDPRMMERIQVVFPFFSVEMHLITKDGSPITSFSQLAGKRVIEGPEGSGTWISVQVIKALTNMKWQGFYASQADGMKALMAGQADAMFIVAGKPVKIIKDTPQARVIPLQHPELDKFNLYTKALIPTGTYPGTKTSVQTYKVDNALITYAFKNERQKEISDMVTCITQNLGRLQSETKQDGTARFHPKWRDVDPTDINRVQWPVHPTAKAAINRVKR